MQPIEDQAYEVPGRQLRPRVAQLRAQGLPFDVQPISNNNYIVIVTQPAGVNPFTYQPAPRGHSSLPADALRWVLVAAVVAALLVVVAVVVMRAESEPIVVQVPATAEDDAGMWGWLPELRLPWDKAPNGEPVVERSDTFRWPWDSAAESMADAAETVQSTVTVASATILAVLVLLIVLAVVRKRGK